MKSMITYCILNSRHHSSKFCEGAACCPSVEDDVFSEADDEDEVDINLVWTSTLGFFTFVVEFCKIFKDEVDDVVTEQILRNLLVHMPHPLLAVRAC
jgi:hypothetical protein